MALAFTHSLGVARVLLGSATPSHTGLPGTIAEIALLCTRQVHPVTLTLTLADRTRATRSKRCGGSRWFDVHVVLEVWEAVPAFVLDSPGGDMLHNLVIPARNFLTLAVASCTLCGWRQPHDQMSVSLSTGGLGLRGATEGTTLLA